ncbi:MAG TPA: hypothetical protein VN428_01790, partial [Bryobacteraceae bacterium]|nr:hypothetical protein [Bryobacteraceae bacterium]
NRLDEFSAPPVSDSFDRKLWARIAAEDGPRRWWRLPLWKPVLSVALACVLLLAVALIRQRSAEVIPQQVQAEVMDAEHIERALDDVEMLRQFDVPDEGQAM